MNLNDKIVNEAKNWLGVKYQHRGTTRNGCDCTGLIIGVMQKLGYVKNYKLRQYPKDWNLHAMASNYVAEEIVRFADKVNTPLPGDVMLFSFGKCIAHAGIKIDKFLFIHTHVDAKRCVVSPLLNNKWTKRMTGAYRFNESKL